MNLTNSCFYISGVIGFDTRLPNIHYNFNIKTIVLRSGFDIYEIEIAQDNTKTSRIIDEDLYFNVKASSIKNINALQDNTSLSLDIIIRNMNKLIGFQGSFDVRGMRIRAREISRLEFNYNNTNLCYNSSIIHDFYSDTQQKYFDSDYKNAQIFGKQLFPIH